jgi:hypothetical protein
VAEDDLQLIANRFRAVGDRNYWQGGLLSLVLCTQILLHTACYAHHLISSLLDPSYQLVELTTSALDQPDIRINTHRLSFLFDRLLTTRSLTRWLLLLDDARLSYCQFPPFFIL